MQPWIEELPAPSHSCLIYQNRLQQTHVTARFLSSGLARKERCVFLDMPDRLTAVRTVLNAMGLNTSEAESSGALILSAKRDFLREGHFDASRVLSFLEEAVNQALVDGYPALRITGDMNWELGGDQDFQVLADYEAQLDALVNDRPIVGMCQYQRYTVSSLGISNALETHANVVFGTQLCANNPYYEPSDVRLERDPVRRQQRRSEWMCRQLTRTLEREPEMSNIS